MFYLMIERMFNEKAPMDSINDQYDLVGLWAARVLCRESAVL